MICNEYDAGVLNCPIFDSSPLFVLFSSCKYCFRELLTHEHFMAFKNLFILFSNNIYKTYYSFQVFAFMMESPTSSVFIEEGANETVITDTACEEVIVSKMAVEPVQAVLLKFYLNHKFYFEIVSYILLLCNFRKAQMVSGTSTFCKLTK